MRAIRLQRFGRRLGRLDQGRRERTDQRDPGGAARVLHGERDVDAAPLATGQVLDARARLLGEADRVTKTLDVGKKPNGITLTPDGKLLLVTLYGENRIALVDTATNDVVGTIPVPKPHTVSVEPSSKLAYATSQEPGHFGLAVIDLGSRSVVSPATRRWSSPRPT